MCILIFRQKKYFYGAGPLGGVPVSSDMAPAFPPG